MRVPAIRKNRRTLSRIMAEISRSLVRVMKYDHLGYKPAAPVNVPAAEEKLCISSLGRAGKLHHGLIATDNSL